MFTASAVSSSLWHLRVKKAFFLAEDRDKLLDFTRAGDALRDALEGGKNVKSREFLSNLVADYSNKGSDAAGVRLFGALSIPKLMQGLRDNPINRKFKYAPQWQPDSEQHYMDFFKGPAPSYSRLLDEHYDTWISNYAKPEVGGQTIRDFIKKIPGVGKEVEGLGDHFDKDETLKKIRENMVSMAKDLWPAKSFGSFDDVAALPSGDQTRLTGASFMNYLKHRDSDLYKRVVALEAGAGLGVQPWIKGYTSLTGPLLKWDAGIKSTMLGGLAGASGLMGLSAYRENQKQQKTLTDLRRAIRRGNLGRSALRGPAREAMQSLARDEASGLGEEETSRNSLSTAKSLLRGALYGAAGAGVGGLASKAMFSGWTPAVLSGIGTGLGGFVTGYNRSQANQAKAEIARLLLKNAI